jgi:hypothetical protein
MNYQNVNYLQLLIDVEEGNEEALKALSIIEPMLKDIKQCRDSIYEQAIEEASKYAETTFEKHGFKFTKKNGSTRYDFKHIESWQNANTALKAIESASKDAFKMSLKNMTAVDSETGEVAELPIVSANKDSLIIKKL